MRYKKSGELIIRHNHIPLLVALYNLPGRAVPFRKMWAELTLEQYGGYYSNHLQATHSLPEDLISRSRVGSSDRFELTATGEDVLFARTPVWVHGRGAF
jgi:hypothetical protein